MSLSDKYNEIQTHMNTLSSHLSELEVKKKKASAPKARASAQLAKNLLMELRKDIITNVKEIPVKPRKKEIISPTHSAVEAEAKAEEPKEPPKTEEPKELPKTEKPKRKRIVKKK